MPIRQIRVGFSQNRLGRTKLATMRIVVAPTKRIINSKFTAMAKTIKGKAVHRTKPSKSLAERAKENELKRELRFSKR